MTEEAVLSFVQASIRSTWELELLLLLYRTPHTSWTPGELNVELRASMNVIEHAVLHLDARGLLRRQGLTVQYRRDDPSRNEIVEELARLCLVKPFAVFSAIRDGASTPLKHFSDAFKLKD